jgi:hypothetical protein
MENEKDTVYDGLALKREWAIHNETHIKNVVDECETVSDSLERMVLLIKNQEFDIETTEITEYEKKLIFTGLQIGNMLLQRKSDALMMQTYRQVLEMLRNGKNLSTE